MTTHHKESALSAIADLVAGGLGEADHRALQHIAIAQATLELAEQQRIANLIAILSAENSDFFTLLPSRAAEPNMYGSAIGAMLADVQKALGFYEEEAN